MYIEAGLTASQMLAADMLFNTTIFPASYIENKNNFSKTQFLGNAAYLFGLKSSGITLKVGPQVQYAFTNLGKAVRRKRTFVFCRYQIHRVSKKIISACNDELISQVNFKTD